MSWRYLIEKSIAFSHHRLTVATMITIAFYDMPLSPPDYTVMTYLLYYVVKLLHSYTPLSYNKIIPFISCSTY